MRKRFAPASVIAFSTVEPPTSLPVDVELAPHAVDCRVVLDDDRRSAMRRRRRRRRLSKSAPFIAYRIPGLVLSCRRTSVVVSVPQPMTVAVAPGAPS
jgi:hypothetical protein